MNIIKAKFGFRNVGQGLFYTGMIGDFTFVYDCGVENGTDKENDIVVRSINKFRQELLCYRFCMGYSIHKKPQLDLLIISHFDWDHISGLKELLTQFEVNTVVIPFVLPFKRLEIASKSFDKTGEHFKFLIDPIAYFKDFNVKNVVIISGQDNENEKENRNKNKPVFDEEHENNDPLKRDILVAIDELPNDKELNDLFGEASKEIKVIFKKSGRISIGYKWELTFFNYDYNEELVEKLKNIDKGYLFEKQQLISVLSSNKVKKIKKEYMKILSSSDVSSILKQQGINNTSIILYHGPIESRHLVTMGCQQQVISAVSRFEKVISSLVRKKKESLERFYKFQKSPYRKENFYSPLNGTLLLGDIDVRSDFNQIYNFFHDQWKKISVILVPHHGSKNNWSVELLNAVNGGPSMWIVSAGATNKYAHPNRQIVNDIVAQYPEKKIFFNNELIKVTIYVFEVEPYYY